MLGALDALKKSKPAAFYTPDAARLITLGNFDDDLALLADCDWIIEAVAENLEIKRALLAKVQEHRRPGTIMTTNTSGLPMAQIVGGHAGGCAAALVRHALLQSAAVHAAAGGDCHAGD